MMWKAVGVMAAGEPGRTISHLMDHANRLKYNEFDYVKRISIADFNKKNEESINEGQ